MEADPTGTGKDIRNMLLDALNIGDDRAYMVVKEDWGRG